MTAGMWCNNSKKMSLRLGSYFALRPFFAKLCLKFRLFLLVYKVHSRHVHVTTLGWAACEHVVQQSQVIWLSTCKVCYSVAAAVPEFCVAVPL